MHSNNLCTLTVETRVLKTCDIGVALVMTISQMWHFYEMMEHGHIHLPVHVISSLNSCIQEKRHYRQKKTQSTCIYLTEMHTRTFACSKDVLCFWVLPHLLCSICSDLLQNKMSVIKQVTLVKILCNRWNYEVREFATECICILHKKKISRS